MRVLKMPDRPAGYWAANTIYSGKANALDTASGSISFQTDILEQALYQHYIRLAVLTVLTDPEVEIDGLDRSTGI